MGRTLSEKLDFIPNDIVSLKDYERYAKKIMDSNSLAYVCSGAGDEITFRRNEEAFSNIFLETNTLEDLKGANTKIELFGQTYESPIFLAPVAYQKLVDENGEINDESYRVNVRGAEIEQQKAMVAIVVSLFMYIAFILISAVGTILAVQSLSDSTKYKYRYLTLRRLGINDKSLFKTIRNQLLILFCVPAISAILCSFVMMSSLNNVYQQILGDKHLYLMYFGLNLIIFFLIYSIYWIATYIGFKRNINEAS